MEPFVYSINHLSLDSIVQHYINPFAYALNHMSLDSISGAGTRDEPLRTSAWGLAILEQYFEFKTKPLWITTSGYN